MNSVSFNHVAANELPEIWRTRLNASPTMYFTVCIEEEHSNTETSEDPLFGMWRDREDMADVDTYVHNLRAPRFAM